MLGRWMLVASAYSPVLVLTGIRVTDGALSWSLVALGLLASFGLEAVLIRSRVSAADQLNIIEVQARDADVPTYTVTFLLPFLVVADASTRDLVALGLFLLLLMYASAHSNVGVFNPLLTLQKLRIAEVVVARGNGRTETVFLICSQLPIVPSRDAGGIPESTLPVRLALRGLYVGSPS